MRKILPLLFLLLFSCKEKSEAPVKEPFTHSITLQVSDSTQVITKEQLERCKQIFKERLHKTGHPLAEVTAQDSNSITFGLYKEVRPYSLKMLLSMETLTFQTLATASGDNALGLHINAIDSILFADYILEKELNPDTDRNLSNLSQILISYKGDLLCKKKNLPTLFKVCHNPSVENYLRETILLPSYTLHNPHDLPRGPSNRDSLYTIYHVNRKVLLDGFSINSASNVKNQFGGGECVSIVFSPEGSKQFETVTMQNINKQLAIIIGNRVVSAPNIYERIPNGKAQISGSFSKNEAKKIAILLHSGKLPVNFIVKK